MPRSGGGIHGGKGARNKGERPAGAAGWVEKGAHHSRPRQRVLFIGEKEVHHEADELSGSEVFPGRLVRQLREPSDQLLVEVAHREVGHSRGVKVDLGEAGDDQVQQVRSIKACDLGVEVELVDNLPSTGRETGDVGLQVPGYLTGVIEQTSEVERRGVEELLARDGAQDRLHVLNATLELLCAFQHGVLRWLKDTVKPTEDGQRQDHLAVLGLLVVSTQKVSDRPNEAGMVLDRGLFHWRLSAPSAHLFYMVDGHQRWRGS